MLSPLKQYILSAGFEYGTKYHNRKYYEIPGEEIHNELQHRLNIMVKEAKKTQQRVVIHVRCSPDILGLELVTFIPPELSYNDGQRFLENQTSFNSICGKTITV